MTYCPCQLLLSLAKIWYTLTSTLEEEKKKAGNCNTGAGLVLIVIPNGGSGQDWNCQETRDSKRAALPTLPYPDFSTKTNTQIQKKIHKYAGAQTNIKCKDKYTAGLATFPKLPF